MASLLFDALAYYAEENPTVTPRGLAELEENALLLGGIVDATTIPGRPATRFLFESSDGGVFFSGNNCQGYLYSLDADGNVIAKYFGEISRLVKTGSTIQAGQFYIYPTDTIPTGDENDTGDPSGTMLLDFGVTVPSPFATGNTVGTSSDPVDTALNALLPGPQPIAAENDTDVAAMPSCDGGTDTLLDTAVGNVVTGDDVDGAGAAVADASSNYSYYIDLAKDPDLQIRYTPLYVTAVSFGTTVSSAVAANSTSVIGGTTIAGQYGTLVIGADGSYVYTPDASNPTLIARDEDDAPLTEVFTYTVSDLKGGTDTATLTISIQGGNDEPVAVNDFVLKDEPASIPVTPFVTGSVVANDTDPDTGAFETMTVTRGEKATNASDETFVTWVNAPATEIADVSKTVSLAYGTVTFGSANLAEGDKVFIGTTDTGLYVDEILIVTGTKYVTFTTSSTVTPGPDTATKAYLAVAVGTTMRFGDSSSTAYTVDTVADPSTTIFKLSDATGVSEGSLVTGEGVPTGTVVSSPVATIAGSSYVTLSAAVTLGTSATASDGQLFTGESLNFVGGAILGNYGYLKLLADGSYKYFLTGDIPTGTVGDEYFTYEIVDESGCKDTAVLHIRIQGDQGVPPTANADDDTVSEYGAGATVIGSLPSTTTGNVIDGTADDTFAGADSGTDPLVVTSAWSNANSDEQTVGTLFAAGGTTIEGAYGTLVIGSDGGYEYTLDNADPEVDALLGPTDTLEDVFWYNLSGFGNTDDTTTLTITITGANDAPGALDDVAIAAEAGGTIAGFDPSGDVLLNDTDVDAGDTKTVSKVVAGTSAPTTGFTGSTTIAGVYGDLVINDDGTFTYLVDDADPDTEALLFGASGNDVFTYEVVDAGGKVSTAKLVVKVQGADDAPAVTGGSYNEGTSRALFTVDANAGQFLTFDVRDVADPEDTISPTGENEANVAGDADGDALGDAPIWYSVDNGATWELYDGTPVEAGAFPVLVAVDVANEQDDVYEGLEQFQLVVNPGEPAESVGYATLIDDGTGTLLSEDKDGNPLIDGNGDAIADTIGPFDDDRVLEIDSVDVNEGSPYAVFTVTGAEGQLVKLSLSGATGDGSPDSVGGAADLGVDPLIEVWDAGVSDWVAYDPLDPPAIAEGETTLLVRVAIDAEQEEEFDGPETFRLVATNTGGTESAANDGIGTIYDDGTGNIYPDEDPVDGVPAQDTIGPFDDDRVLEVDSVDVNEGSPYAVFTVTGAEGQLVKLSLSGATGDGSPDSVGGAADLGVDPLIEVWDGTDWVEYDPLDPPAIAEGETTLLVRVAIDAEQEEEFDGPETFRLVATNTGGTESAANDGVGTIYDDGTGNIYPDEDPVDGVPAQDTIGPFDDDRVLEVDSVDVNEGSPYAVFTVTGAEGQLVKLSLSGATGDGSPDSVGGSADLGVDPLIEVWDGTDWVEYDPLDPPAIAEGETTLLVRVAIDAEQEEEFDGPETFRLVATNTGGTESAANDGIGTIYDDGTGNIYPDEDPVDGVPAQDTIGPFDDDRVLEVDSVDVNEGSPYAVFTVTGAEGQLVKLSLSGATGDGSPDSVGGAADLGVDPLIEVWDGTDWVEYDPLDPPAIAEGETTLLVRVAIDAEQEEEFDGPETFRLVATNTGGTESAANDGIGTIYDDGTGNIYPDEDPVDGVPAQDTIGPFDDDRVLEVDSVDVNEGSPYAVFTVTGAEGQLVKLSLSGATGDGSPDSVGGAADLGVDPLIEVWDGTDWVEYDPLDPPAIAEGETTLLVRVAIDAEQEEEFDGPETFRLVATNTGGTESAANDGIGTIYDDGTGNIYPDEDPVDGVPAQDTIGPFDDDRVLEVNSVHVNEGSPYAVFTVSGAADQRTTLRLETTGSGDGYAVEGPDYGPDIDYYDPTIDNGDGSFGGWVEYTGQLVTLDGDGELLVRTRITNDTPSVLEGDETFRLVATNTGGTDSALDDGIGTISDDGSGEIFLEDNDTGTPDDPEAPGYEGPPLDDDRLLDINNPVVNEASPYIVFEVAGSAGQNIELWLETTGSGRGFATGTADYGPALEWFDGEEWQPYVPGETVPLGDDGRLLVRTSITNDDPAVYEGAETFRLVAASPGGPESSGGIGAIVDDGTGDVFLEDNESPEPNDPQDPGYPPQLDDDRTIFVTGGTYNENSPRAIFTVDASEGQLLTFDVRDQAAPNKDATGTNPGAEDDLTDAPLWYSLDGGDTWSRYTGEPVTAGPVDVLVAVDITNERDAPYEGEEQLQLVVNAGEQTESAGFASIRDDGTGTITRPIDGSTRNYAGRDTGEVKDDDRAITVTGAVYNENSARAIFTVDANPGQPLTLDVRDLAPAGQKPTGSLPGPEDDLTVAPLWYSLDGGATWQAYDGGFITSGEVDVLVAVDITPERDDAYEIAEQLQLVVNAGQVTEASGYSTIRDDGTGRIVGPIDENTKDNPGVDTGEVRDDDRASIAVTSPFVNEGSPYAVFTVSGGANQLVTLTLADGTATSADYGGKLEYSTNGGLTWKVYTGGQVALSSTGGTMLVRTPVKQDNVNEPDETFTLTATTKNGLSAVGTATIQDDGNGTIFDRSGAPDPFVVKDDDRGVEVNSIDVNESSPYAVFTVTANPGQQLKLAMAEGTASDGVGGGDPRDFGPALQVFNGTAWVNYAAGSWVTPPNGGGTLLVRTTPVDDEPFEGAETFSLTVTSSAGKSATGTATIHDDGTGDIYPDNTTGAKDDAAAKGDDRDLTPPSAPEVTIVEDDNDDGYINLAELSGDADVEVALPDDAVAGDVLTVTDGTTTRTFVLTPEQIVAGVVATSFAAPAEGTTLTVTARVTDAVGNVGPSDDDAALRDTLAPAVTITAIGVDTQIDGDFLTSDRTLVFSGTAEAGRPVTVLLDGVVLGTVIAGPDGAWSLDHTATTLAVGTYALEARVADVAGNTASASRPFTVFAADLDPATDDGVSNQDRVTSVIEPEFTIRGGPLLAEGDTVRLLDPQGRVMGSAVVSAEDAARGLVNVPADQLDDGTYTFLAQVVGPDGRVKGEVPVTVTIVTDRDGVMPSVELAANEGDFNDDGVEDWQQNNVAQLPLSSLEDFLAGRNAPDGSFGAVMAGTVDPTDPDGAVELDSGAQLLDIRLEVLPGELPDDLTPVTPNLHFAVTSQQGRILEDLDPARAGLQTRVVIDLPQGVVADTFVKWDDEAGAWYEYLDDQNLATLDDGATLVDFEGDGLIDRVVVTLTDGARGDADGLVNGTIVDPGLLAIRAGDPVYCVTLANGDKYYSTDAAEVARMAAGTQNRFEGVVFDSVSSKQGGEQVFANYQPFTQDWYFAFDEAAMPYACYFRVPEASGFGAWAAGQGEGEDYHLYLNSAGQTWLATKAEAGALGLAAQGYTDLGAQFNTTAETAFAFDAEGYLVAHDDDAGVRTLVQSLSSTYRSTSDAGFVEAVEAHYLAQLAEASLVGTAQFDPADAAAVNAAFGTGFVA